MNGEPICDLRAFESDQSPLIVSDSLQREKGEGYAIIHDDTWIGP